MPTGIPIEPEEAEALKARILHLLENSDDDVTFTDACRTVDVSRTWAYEARAADASFDLAITQILKRGRETLLDLAEGSLHKATRNGEAWAVKQVLNLLGRDRGYAQKVIGEHVGKGGGAIQLAHTFPTLEEAAEAYAALRKL